MRFEVGCWYNFTIENLKYIPEQGEYYILRYESSGRKMLLKASYYVKYNYNISDKIECKIDKVNCSGQIFLEPRNPHYQEGKEYDFQIISTQDNTDGTFNIVVKDILDNDIQVLINNESYKKDQSTIKLLVEKIRKGILYLSEVNDSDVKTNLLINQIIELKLVTIISYNGEDYYSLSNGKVIVSRLKYEHYKYYGFELGANIKCLIIEFEKNGMLKVEPENPWYRIGQSYEFIINSIEEFTNLDGEKESSIIVLDASGRKCGISIFSQKYHFRVGKSIHCTVKGFRKGRPQLEIDPE